MGPIKVAIADDHKIFRKGVILSLRPYPNIKFVLEAENGQELIDNLPTVAESPDVILMDNWIPDIGGIKATRLIKESDRFQQIPVIFFSANNDVTEMAANAGAEFSLQKPFDISELENIVVKAANKVHS